MARTIKSRPGFRTTRSNRKPRSKHAKIVKTMLEMLNVVKLYHWKTHSHPEHVATDQLYGRLNENIDKFVETMLGKRGTRIQDWNPALNITQYSMKKPFKEQMEDYREFLSVDLTHDLDPKKDTDLLNIRDEILGDINQFLYLMTFH